MLNAYAKSVPPEHFDESDDEIAKHLDHVELLTRVAKAFSNLAPEQRDVLLLTAIEGLTYAETSEALGIPIGTVHSRVSRARITLRDLAGFFGQEGTEEPISAIES
jgi:RNA polymerase sigma-70 factor (ECF subfamily)